MSNRAYLDRTMFVGDSGSTSWGWLLGDDWFRNYVDTFDEREVPADPLDLLAKAAAGATSEEQSLFQALLDNGAGILINGSWHESEEIAPVLRKALYEEDEDHG